MKRMFANDGTFYVSVVNTKEKQNIAFAYAWESAVPEYAKVIATKFPEYFVFEHEQDLWLKTDVDNKISIEDLKDAAALDETNSVVIADLDSKEILAGVPDSLDFKSLK